MLSIHQLRSVIVTSLSGNRHKCLVALCSVFSLLSFSVYAAKPVQQVKATKTVAQAHKTTQKKDNPPLALTYTINKILKNFDDNINIGVFVADANTGQVLYSKNADRLFMPASNQKLITAFAALNFLSPQFVYQTNLFTDTTKLQNGTLHDNIYLQFTGDPTLKVAQLDRLLSALMTVGVTHIEGNIIVDDTMFDQMPMSVGTTWDDKDYCWGAPLSAIMIEHNCVRTLITPAAQAGVAANMVLPDYQQSLQFINNVVTANAATACKLEVKRTHPNAYTISGCIHVGDKGQEIRLAIDNPRANLQSVLSYLLSKYQITTTGAIEFKKIENPPRRLAAEASPPVAGLVKTMLKESDNLIANALFKTIGAAYTHESGSFRNGSEAIRNILQRSIQLPIANTTLLDGAGISRYNFLTPKQLAYILQKNYLLPKANLFNEALPIGGIDGTLKNRLRDPATNGRVFAKTGTETAVSTLSGYVHTRNQKTLIFSIMINGFVDLPARYEALEDAICKALVEMG